MWTFGVFLTILMFLSSFSKCQTEAAVMADSSSSSLSSDLVPNEPIRIKMLATSPVSKKHTRTRQNSRFLRTFPPVELLNMARQSAMDNEISPVRNFNRNSVSYENYDNYESYGSRGNYGNQMNHYPTKARIDAGNSPIFYIKLPPVPYVFMPGVGFVSPHPYSNSPSSSSSMPMTFSSGSVMMPPGMGSFMPMGMGQPDSSAEQSSQSFHLPLKFLSNGRPHQIESPKRKKRPGNKENSSESKKTALISGGNYHFNGRPTAVFVVRSPAKSIENKY